MRVAVHGYLDAAVGVGEAARRGIEGLMAQGVEVEAHSIELDGRDLACPRPGGWPGSAAVGEGPLDAELLYVNPERLGELLADVGPRRRGVRRVGIWSWESDVVPRPWIAAACDLDEVWTYSRVSAAILGAALTVPVIEMPIPVTCAAALPAPSLPPRDGPRVTCVFDHLSTLERKNPLGAIEAFSRAFPEQDGPQLVVKTMGARHRPDAHRRLVAAAGRRCDVVVFDGVLEAGSLVGLLLSSAALLSLHRSEGFGLLPAEAALLGVPVVATGFGGILDFLDDQSAWLVDHCLVDVGEGVEHYPPNGTWAEPDLDHAAAGLREIVEDPAAAAARAATARARVTGQFDAAAIGRRMRDRLRADAASARRAGPGRTGTRGGLRVPVVVGVPFRGEHELGQTLRALDERTAADVPIVVACGPADLAAAQAAQSSVGSARVELLVADGAPTPWPQLLAALISAGLGDLALVAPGVSVGEGWLDGLVAAAAGRTVASSSALVVDHTGGGRTLRRRGEPARPPDAARVVRDGAWRSRPRLSFVSSRCALLRRPAIDLLGDFDPQWSEPGQVLSDFGARATACGLRNVVADEVLVGDSRPRLRGLWPPGEEAASRSSESPAVPGPIRATNLGSNLGRSLDWARWLAAGPDVTIVAGPIGRWGDGSQVYAIELAVALAHAGVDRLRVVTAAGLGERQLTRLADAPGVEVIARDELSGREPPSTIVHLPRQVSAPADLTSARRLGRRLVLTQPDLIEYRIESYHEHFEAWSAHRRLTRAAIAAADLTVVFSDCVRRELIADGLVAEERVRVVGVGQETPCGARPSPGEPNAVAPAGLAVASGPFMLCLGDDLAHRNRPFALRLLLELRARHGWTGSLVLSGPDAEFGSSRDQELAFLAAHPELASSVQRLGSVGVSGRAWLLTHASAVVHPSATEGHGLVPWECAGVGCPCLFAPVGGLAELGEEVATIVPWDAAASAARVRPVLEAGPERSAHLARLGAATRRASWREAAEATLAAYEHAMHLPDSAASPRAWEEAAREEELTRLTESEAHYRLVARRSQDALHRLESSVGDALPLAARDGVLTAAERRGLMVLAARRPWTSVLFGPIAAIGGLAGRLRGPGDSGRR